jgi:2'-hydroxyisoflavone reductase
VRAVAPPRTTLTWVDEQFLLDEKLDDSALPLWSGGDPDVLMMTADPAAALATGLAARPLEDTVRDTLAWAEATPMPAGTGIDPDREADLLRRWRESR